MEITVTGVPAGRACEGRSARSSRSRAKPTTKTTRTPTWRSSTDRRPPSAVPGARRSRPRGHPARAPPAANLWRWPHRSPTPRGSSRSPPAAVAIVALDRLRGAERSACAACGRRSGWCWASTASRTSSRTRPRMQEAFDALRAYVRGDGRAPGRALGGVESGAARAHRPPRARALRRLQRALRPASRCRSRCSTTNSSGIVLSCIHHRDQARVYGKQMHAGRGELELSPEEAEAVRLALGRRRGRRRVGRRMSSRPETPPGGRPASAIWDRRGPSPRRRCWPARRRTRSSRSRWRASTTR